MKSSFSFLFLSSVLLLMSTLSGCASGLDEYGNYNNVKLTEPEMRAIGNDIAQFLRQSEGSRRIINLDHDGSLWATTLVDTLRHQGLGVSTHSQDDYLTLTYKIESLNATQFSVTALLSDGRQLSRIWVVDNNQLIPLKTRAYGGIEHE